MAKARETMVRETPNQKGKNPGPGLTIRPMSRVSASKQTKIPKANKKIALPSSYRFSMLFRERGNAFLLESIAP